MIIRLLLLIALPLIAYWAAQRIAQRVTLSRAQYRWLIVSIAALMAVAVLIALGRVPFQFILAPLGLAATTLFRALPALLRFLPMLQMLKGHSFALLPRSNESGKEVLVARQKDGDIIRFWNGGIMKNFGSQLNVNTLLRSTCCFHNVYIVAGIAHILKHLHSIRLPFGTFLV